MDRNVPTDMFLGGGVNSSVWGPFLLGPAKNILRKMLGGGEVYVFLKIKGSKNVFSKPFWIRGGQILSQNFSSSIFHNIPKYLTRCAIPALGGQLMEAFAAATTALQNMAQLKSLS